MPCRWEVDRFVTGFWPALQQLELQLTLAGREKGINADRQTERQIDLVSCLMTVKAVFEHT